MNINIFKKIQQPSLTGEISFADENALDLKKKIDARKKKQKRIKMILAGLIALVVFFAALTVYSQYRLMTLSKDELGGLGATSTPKTGEEVISLLSRHILLPPGTPQVAEIEDISRLRDKQAFFKDAENGDIVVVYETTIFIYRPSRDIVIAAGDISGVDQLKP